MQGRKPPPAPQVFVYADPYAKLPRNAFYQALDTHLDLTWVRPATAGLYANGVGRPSLDPVVFVKLMLVAYFENAVGDSELAFRIADSLTVRRFLGYGLDEVTPERTTILKTRQRWPEEVFGAIFVRVLEQLAEHGLVKGEHLGTDTLLVDANASLDSLRHRELGCSYAEFVKALYAQDGQLASAGDIAAKDANRLGKASNAEWVSTTDPDTAIAVHPDGHTALSYRLDATTDLETGAVVQIGLASGNVRDSVDLPQRLEETKETLTQVGLTPSVLTADRGHHSEENLVEVEAAGVTPIIRAPAVRGVPGFKVSDFVYESETDQYQCPAGQPLHRKGTSHHGKVRYQARGSVCRGCEHFGVCTKAQHGRAIDHSLHAAEVAANRERVHSELGRELLGKHRQRAEGPWSYAKLYGGLARMNTRGGSAAMRKALIQGIGWNVMKLIAHLTGLTPRGRSAAKALATALRPVFIALSAIAAHLSVHISFRSRIHRRGHRGQALLLRCHPQRRASAAPPNFRQILPLSRGC